MVFSQTTSVEQEFQQFPSRRAAVQAVLAAALAVPSLPGLADEVCTN